ncbi:hypothetical protein C8R43DRAFT_943473 [Mycena crocata]|nr:hypothetical protein C8R43DRAFT_943473 [Mycena crocata]
MFYCTKAMHSVSAIYSGSLSVEVACRSVAEAFLVISKRLHENDLRPKPLDVLELAPSPAENEVLWARFDTILHTSPHLIRHIHGIKIIVDQFSIKTCSLSCVFDSALLSMRTLRRVMTLGAFPQPTFAQQLFSAKKSRLYVCFYEVGNPTSHGISLLGLPRSLGYPRGVWVRQLEEDRPYGINRISDFLQEVEEEFVCDWRPISAEREAFELWKSRGCSDEACQNKIQLVIHQEFSFDCRWKSSQEFRQLGGIVPADIEG